MSFTFTINSNENKKSLEVMEILKQKLKKVNINYSDKLEKNTDLIISIGGDGSFLKTVRDFQFIDTPILAINTGHLGFFAEILPDEIDDFIETYLSNKHTIQKINLLDIKIFHSNGEYIQDYAINELVVRGANARTTHLTLSVNENYMETFSGDGMIIATSVGSTAYTYSARGSIVDNRLNTIQITPISPISTNAFRSFTSSIILPAESSTVSITPEYHYQDSIVLVVDGLEKIIEDIENIKTSHSERKISLFRMPNYEFWNRVSNKFL